jgi:hypothetical protein
MRGVLGHDWNRPVARLLTAEELLPGDPRLPRSAPDGSRWPPSAGALRVKARFLLNTRDGREAWEVAKAFGTSQNFSIGYKVTPTGARQRGGTRYITDLDVFEFSPVLHGAARLATLISVKGAAMSDREFKSTGGVGIGAVNAVNRARLFRAVTCSVCNQVAAGVDGIGMPDGHKLICTSCMDVLDNLAVEAGTITAAQLSEAAALDDAGELTSEEEYDAALDAEQLWDLNADGTLNPAADEPERWSAWGRS